jgi:hypothetical protein
MTTRQPAKERSVSSTTDSTAVFVKMDPQPLNPPFNARVENGELWWELNERDNWHRDDNNKPPYKPGDTLRDWRYSYVVKSIEPVMRDGAWWWRIGVETRSDS